MDMKKVVDGYLSALGISEIKTLKDIEKLQKAHLQTFAFTSMKVLLNEDISLELEDVYKSIVVQKRGGYCFEHNKLIYEVLKYLGFDVQNVLARVILERDYMPPLTHRFSVLNFEGEKYIVDVGIGSHSPYMLVKLKDENSINNFGVEYKVIEKDDNFYYLETKKENKSFTTSRFRLDECYDIDFELGHFYSHKYPSAVFVNNLVSSIINDNAIYSLTNRVYSKFYKNKVEKIQINSANELEDILRNELNLNFTKDEINRVFKFIETIE